MLEKVRGVLRETSALLVDKYGFAPETQQTYAEKCMGRFANPYLPDPVERVGRSPLRKLSRHDRIISPAAELAERGLPTDALMGALGAALAFTPEGDPEVESLQEILRSQGADEATATLAGLEPSHPLFAAVREQVAARQANI